MLFSAFLGEEFYEQNIEPLSPLDIHGQHWNCTLYTTPSSGALASNRQNISSPKYNDDISLCLSNNISSLIQSHLSVYFWKGRYCSKTMLTGESRFRISTTLGIEPGSLMMGSKGLTHWTSETVCECSEIAGSPQGSPPAADYVFCEAGRRTCSEHDTGTGELCEIKWDYHIVGDDPVMVRDEARLRRGHNDQSRRCHQCSETTLTGESRFHISRKYPRRDLTWVPHDGKQRVDPLDQ